MADLQKAWGKGWKRGGRTERGMRRGAHLGMTESAGAPWLCLSRA